MLLDELLTYLWSMNQKDWSRIEILAYQWNLSVDEANDMLEVALEKGCVKRCRRDNQMGISSSTYWRLNNISKDEQVQMIIDFNRFINKRHASDFATYKPKKGAN